MDIPDALIAEASNHPFQLLFATVSGAHLYGFPSADSDFDLRGVHILPLRDVVGIDPGRETVEMSGVRSGLEIDLVTHDIRKFISLLLRRNGYVLEQLYSPIVVCTTPEHEELKEIAAGCVTRYHSHHYLGFAQNQWRLFEKERPPRVKPLLYVFRVLLTGIHLMRTGVIEANLSRLNEEFRLPFIDELVARKLSGTEAGRIDIKSLAFYEDEYQRLLRTLEEAFETSDLPESPTARPALNDFLVRVRLSPPATGTLPP